VKLLKYRNGHTEGPAMTAGELLSFLRDIPPETVVAGAWEGIHMPLRAARFVTDINGVAGDFVELDVDKQKEDRL
jgi:hypothetical protein